MQREPVDVAIQTEIHNVCDFSTILLYAHWLETSTSGLFWIHAGIKTAVR